MKQVILVAVVMCVLSPFAVGYCRENSPALEFIYGNGHAFTVRTPEGWVSDSPSARAFDLLSFFCPAHAVTKTETYLYAQAWDKADRSQTIQDFIESDLNDFKNQQHSLSFTRKKSAIKPPCTASWHYTFSGIDGGYREDIVYMETEHSFAVLVYSSNSKANYDRYMPVFDGFVRSFHFRDAQE
ncbi:hypothetical protein [Desulfoluna butyratoxydans]|uniref:Uncharacterized protein n=1 Tax=Desulfoluna butyratoxydans TaxID=231438 RepID=A0A4V6ILN5_9BACT|nr:hypothetical protein [Desulfoluna butyratoxydans]VFQ45798.1 hypothetical protein MSL71_34600 [Desulfoluna butyratoxydans]